MLETVVAIAGLVLYLGPFALIIRKAGYSPLWILLAFVPVVNVGAFLLFALTEWPIEKQLQQLTPARKSPSDIKAEASWELKRLAKRVAMVKQLATSEGPDEAVRQMLDTTAQSTSEYFHQTLTSLEQFISRATEENEKAYAENLLNTARIYEAEFRDG